MNVGMTASITERSVSSGRRCGALPLADGSVLWRVWAPRARRVDLVLIGDETRVVGMRPEGRGHFTHLEPKVPEGRRYAFRLNGGEDRPDPCSLWQPQGVPGPSAVLRTQDFQWTDQDWRGVRREDLAFYELHVGAFTAEGTFEAVIPRLPALKELGVTALELMPAGQFPGTRNWGYDGVLPYAAQHSYGGPHGLAKLVDAAHSEGLAVFLDVVYNHLGPEGNHLQEFGPYFTDRYKTPWGSAINYDGSGSDPVRDWVLDNVRMWLEEFHLDGLRLDAVHALYDLGARHIVRAVKETADAVAVSTGREIHIVGESDLNDPRILLPAKCGGHGLDAQWSDDFHHAVHAFLTGERRGYYQDYGGVEQVADVMRTPFLFAWDYSPHRDRKHGAPPDGLSGDRFVVCLQNHDQVGNRAKGDRLGVLLASPAKRRLAACLMLFSPHLPLLFMGEEYGETNPFPFFCSFCGGELVQAVREGRKREFADFMSLGEAIPCPDAQATFDSARLSWSWPPGTDRAGLRRLYRDLLAARVRWPALKDYAWRGVRLTPDGKGAGVLELVRGWSASRPSGTMTIFFNLSDRPAELPDRETAETKAVLFSSEWKPYGGRRVPLEEIRDLEPFECIALGPPASGRLA